MPAVFFDLDDTLLDHQHSRRQALVTLQSRYPALARVGLEELQLRHEQLLQTDYSQVLKRTLTPLEATAERIRRLCSGYALELAPAEALDASAAYEDAYGRHRQLIPGSLALLEALAGRAHRGIITNGLSELQRSKIKACGLEPHVEAVVISEEVGVAKPEPGIFQTALRQAGLEPAEAVMVGDSWEVDILGARNAGLGAVWLNRYGQVAPDPEIAAEIRTYEPLPPVLDCLFRAWKK